MCMSCGNKPMAQGHSSYTPKKSAVKAASRTSKSSTNAALKGWGAGFGASANFGQPKVSFSSRKK